MGHHYSDAMLTRCGDDNYAEGRKYYAALERIKKHANAAGAFEPNSFGASLEMVLPEGQAIWEYRLTKVVPALGIDRHVIVDHLGCGAFGIHFGNLSPTEEKEKHLETMALAIAFHQKKAPNIKPVLYLHADENAENEIYLFQNGKLIGIN